MSKLASNKYLFSASIMCLFIILLASCISTTGKPISQDTIRRKYGPITYSATHGDIAYYRHKESYNDIEGIFNPYITITQNGLLMKHARLSETLDDLAEIETQARIANATFPVIELYGIRLGSNISGYSGFRFVSINKETGLTFYSDRSKSTGWDSIVVQISANGIIEEINLLKNFDSAQSMETFALQTSKAISQKFVPAEMYFTNDTGLQLIYGTQSKYSYKATIKSMLDSFLQYDSPSTNGFSYIPYIINPILDRIGLYYSKKLKVVTIRAQSNQVEWKSQQMNLDILNDM